MSLLFDVIYADPPWRYDNRPGRTTGHYGDVEGHYPTLAAAEVADLRVPAARDAVLFLWATAPLLPEALEVMQAWGFRYKSGAVWDKDRPGLGYWFFGQHEHLLVGVRGRWSPPPVPLRVPSVYRVLRTSHSRKPAVVRSQIAAWYPNARRLEMFCRSPAPGWHVWGNQVDSTRALEEPDRYDPAASRYPGQRLLDFAE